MYIRHSQFGDTSIAQLPLTLNSVTSNYKLFFSPEVIVHLLKIPNFHSVLCAVYIAFVCRLYRALDLIARRDSAILAYVIRSTWPRPLQPFPRVVGHL